MDNLDDLFFNEFLKGFEEQEQKKILLSREEQDIAQRKSVELEPIRKFLQKFIDLDVKVKHCDYHSRDVLQKLDIMNDAQPFNYYNEESSTSFSPGISIMIDHPAQIEIAVPNNKEEGIVVVKVATYHPDAHILSQSFGSIESVCQALARFISKNTVSISKEAKSMMNKERQTTGIVRNIPQVNAVQERASQVSLEQHEANSQEFLKSIPDAPPNTNNTTNNTNTNNTNIQNTGSTGSNSSGVVSKEKKFDKNDLLKNMKNIDKIIKKINSDEEKESE